MAEPQSYGNVDNPSQINSQKTSDIYEVKRDSKHKAQRELETLFAEHTEMSLIEIKASVSSFVKLKRSFVSPEVLNSFDEDANTLISKIESFEDVNELISFENQLIESISNIWLSGYTQNLDSVHFNGNCDGCELVGLVFGGAIDLVSSPFLAIENRNLKTKNRGVLQYILFLTNY